MASSATRKTRKTRREQAADSTRKDLLDAGVALATEAITSGAADPLRLLGPKAIAERASRDSAVGPVTRGMLYHLWPSENREDPLEAYRVELFCKLFEGEFASQRFSALIHENIGDPVDAAQASVAGLICQVANIQYRAYHYGGDRADHYRGSTLLVVAGEALRRAGKLSEDDLRRIRAQRSDVTLTEAYQHALDAHDLEIIPPLQIEDAQQMLWSIQDGFTMNSWHLDRLDRSHDLAEWGDDWRGVANEHWSLMAITVYSLIHSITRKRTTSSHRPPSARSQASIVVDRPRRPSKKRVSRPQSDAATQT